MSVELPDLRNLFFEFRRRQFGPIKLARYSLGTKPFACDLVLGLKLFIVDIVLSGSENLFDHLGGVGECL